MALDTRRNFLLIKETKQNKTKHRPDPGKPGDIIPETLTKVCPAGLAPPPRPHLDPKLWAPLPLGF